MIEYIKRSANKIVLADYKLTLERLIEHIEEDVHRSKFSYETLGEWVVSFDLNVDDIVRLLIKKNKTYGNAIADPKVLLCHQTPFERICSRMQDKLNRLVCGTPYEKENDHLDIAGYMLLAMAIHEKNK